MRTGYQSHRLTWDGVDIEIRYCPDWLDSCRETYGYALAHLEIETVTRESLPITETGYLSHFTRADNVTAYGGPAAYVQNWLEIEAQRRDWKDFEDQRRQLALF